VATDNSHLHERVLTGDFQKVFYDGLNPFHIKVSPLRVKWEDVPALLQLSVNKYSFKMGKKGVDIPEKVTDFSNLSLAR